MSIFRVKKDQTLDHEGKKYSAGDVLDLSEQKALTVPWAIERIDGDVGDRLRIVRAEKSQDEFADILGVSRNTVARYERKERNPDSAYLERVCSFFPHIDPAWLLTGEGTAERDESMDQTARLLEGEFLRMDLIRLYEANCKLQNPTDEDLALRSSLTKRLHERIGLVISLRETCECGKNLRIFTKGSSGLFGPAAEPSEWQCPFCKRIKQSPGNVVHVELDETYYFDLGQENRDDS